MKMRTRTNQPVEGDELDYLKVNGDLDITGDLDATGDADVGGDLDVTGDANVGGDLGVTGDISGDAITGNSIIENMTGYSGEIFVDTLTDLDVKYAGCVKTGNKITFSLFFTFTYDNGKFKDIFRFIIPTSVGSKIIPYTLGGEPLASEISVPVIKARDEVPVQCYGEVYKPADNNITFSLSTKNVTLEVNATYLCRMEVTFLLSNNLIPEE